jgi:hypothetical protein
MKILIFTMTGLLLASCNPFGFAKPDSEKITQSNWADNSPKPVLKPLYCYKTLGDSMCYKDPVEGGENRLVGQNDPYTPPKEKEWWEYFK